MALKLVFVCIGLVSLHAMFVDAAFVARMRSNAKIFAARNLAAAGLPDPTCATGVVSLKTNKKVAQVCCAGYCGECSDYASCGKVRGQDSTYACCQSKVHERRCGAGAAANVCIKSCSDTVPPCIMDKDVTYTKPDPKARNAGTDCNKAVPDWRKKAVAAKEVGEKNAAAAKPREFCKEFCPKKGHACCIKRNGKASSIDKPNNKMLDECVSKKRIWCRQGKKVEKKGSVKFTEFKLNGKQWPCNKAICSK